MYSNLTSLFILFLTLSDCFSVFDEEFIKKMLREEREMRVGGKLVLKESEKCINKKILRLKKHDLFEHDEGQFLASKNFMRAKKDIKRSKLFKLIKRIPKGASLHTHLFASVSSDYLLNNLTYHPNLHACKLNNSLKLKFFENPDKECNWTSVETLRKNHNNYNKQLFNELILSPSYNKTQAWKQLGNYFKAVYQMLTYRPVFELYIEQALKELNADKVCYVEFRGNFLQLYELNGTIWNPAESLNILKSVVMRFKAKHEFFGAKYIVALYRALNREGLVRGFNQVKKTNLVVGFDLVGEETEENSLDKISTFLDEEMKDVSYYFHAGETNWYGSKSDLNILYATALNTKRIGHAYSLIKHPKLLEFVKKNKICVEVSPISNQVLGLVKDLRNHPAAVLMAHGAPIVICNDDPGVWQAKGLSYDWYLAFTAMTNENAGLEVLKELALNSLKFSGLDDDNKKAAIILFNKQWNGFIRRELKRGDL